MQMAQQRSMGQMRPDQMAQMQQQSEEKQQYVCGLFIHRRGRCRPFHTSPRMPLRRLALALALCFRHRQASLSRGLRIPPRLPRPLRPPHPLRPPRPPEGPVARMVSASKGLCIVFPYTEHTHTHTHTHSHTTLPHRLYPRRFREEKQMRSSIMQQILEPPARERREWTETNSAFAS